MRVGRLVRQHRFEASENDFRYTRRPHNDVEDRRCRTSKQSSPTLLGHLVGSAPHPRAAGALSWQ